MQKNVFLALIFSFSLHAIENYTLTSLQYNDGNESFIITRSFEDKGQTYYLSTQTHTLQTRIIQASSVTPKALNKDFEVSHFGKLLVHTTALHTSGGQTHAWVQTPKKVFLTMDMCPSRKSGYESDFIEKLTRINGKTPLAIAITSAWIAQHEKAFEALKSHPLLNITWVNHTHTHFYDKTLPNHENFMRHAKTDVAHEILGLEKDLIERGITPSIFFRFPGLIADETLMKALREEYFLIPLGSNAWIAKGEAVKAGSFILIHGNKNEPLGISMLEEMLPELRKRYTFAPIHEAFVP